MAAALLLALVPAMAQRPGQGRSDNRPGGRYVEPYFLNITASTNEMFVVYVDGDIVNTSARRSVEITFPDNAPHDVYVVLERPYKKITMMVYQAVNRREECRVRYNPEFRGVELMLPNLPNPNQPGPDPHGWSPNGNGEGWNNYGGGPAVHHHCPEQEVDQMVAMLHNESFNSNRSKMALAFVQGHYLTSAQILRLCREFTFESDRVDFLEKAFPYCVDPENYVLTTQALTFNSDKEKILNLITNNR